MGLLSRGGGGVPGRVASVVDLPVYVADALQLFVKVGSVGRNDASASTFFDTHLSKAGLAAAVRVAAADTWVTAVDVAARGYLAGIVLPGSTGSGVVSSVRVTVDGVAKTLQAAAGVGLRCVVGGLVSGAPTTVAGDGAAPIVGPGAIGFGVANNGFVPAGNCTLVTVFDALAAGIPVLEFFSSLKVEFKRSSAGSSAVVDFGGVVYDANIAAGAWS